MRRLLALTLVLLAPADLPAAVEVRVSGERVDVQATNAPLAEILEGLSRQTHIKIVYEGPPPRQLLTVDLKGRTPAEALLAILEGQGLGYALALDRSGTRVETLLMTGVSTASSTAPEPKPAPVPLRRAREPVVEEQPLDEANADAEELPPDTGRPEMIKPVPAKPAEAPPPAAGVFLPAPGSADYPTSAFAPRPPELNKPPKTEPTPPPFNP